ncbi:MAG: cell division protein CrgA [Actinobacteria bacterium]|nr:cell division protein CrgA [Actinomycetota bacterium]MCB9411529.1 cell division protein CrgA [Actinomycetota bacterium]
MAVDPDDTPTTSKTPSAPKATPSSNAAGSRKKSDGGSRASRPKPVRLDSPRWLLPVMIACFIIGLVWIVAYYVAPDAPVIGSIGWWNVLIGFGFFTAGFFLSTKWK